MQFSKAFSFVFDDPDWVKKILIASLIALIPIIGGIFVLGYGLEIARRVITRDTPLLPDLDFGASLSTGFQGMVVGLVYSLPIILMSIPYGILMSVMDNNSDLGVMGTTTALCFSTFAFLYSLVMAFVVPAALGNMVAKGRLSAGLRLGEVFGLVRSAPVTYLVVLLGWILAGIVASLGMIACVVGMFVTITYSYAVLGHFIGQAYLDAAYR